MAGGGDGVTWETMPRDNESERQAVKMAQSLIPYTDGADWADVQKETPKMDEMTRSVTWLQGIRLGVIWAHKGRSFTPENYRAATGQYVFGYPQGCWPAESSSCGDIRRLVVAGTYCDRYTKEEVTA